MGIPSTSEPESELKPPPCTLMSTRSRLAAGMVERLDDVASDAAHRLLFDVHRIKLARFLCPADAELVGGRAPFGERGLRA